MTQKTETTTVRPQILVVDDEPHLCNVVHRILKKEGYEVATAGDGEKALELIRETAPDLVLLDIIMPGMDGREVCRKVREAGSDTRVIYFTGKAEPFDPTKLMELQGEADAFLAKPATSKQILSRVNAILRGGRK